MLNIILASKTLVQQANNTYLYALSLTIPITILAIDKFIFYYNNKDPMTNKKWDLSLDNKTLTSRSNSLINHSSKAKAHTTLELELSRLCQLAKLSSN